MLALRIDELRFTAILSVSRVARAATSACRRAASARRVGGGHAREGEDARRVGGCTVGGGSGIAAGLPNCARTACVVAGWEHPLWIHWIQLF
jgi:hypothetical protein